MMFLTVNPTSPQYIALSRASGNALNVLRYSVTHVSVWVIINPVRWKNPQPYARSTCTTSAKMSADTYTNRGMWSIKPTRFNMQLTCHAIDNLSLFFYFSLSEGSFWDVDSIVNRHPLDVCRQACLHNSPHLIPISILDICRAERQHPNQLCLHLIFKHLPLPIAQHQKCLPLPTTPKTPPRTVTPLSITTRAMDTVDVWRSTSHLSHNWRPISVPSSASFNSSCTRRLTAKYDPLSPKIWCSPHSQASKKAAPLSSTCTSMKHREPLLKIFAPLPLIRDYLSPAFALHPPHFPNTHQHLFHVPARSTTLRVTHRHGITISLLRNFARR